MTRPGIRVKICGITTVRDALAAVRAGAGAIGLVFVAESPRRVTPAQARRIVDRLPRGVVPIGVFVNEPLARLAVLARRCRLGALQLHGEETPADCRAARRRTGRPVIKALRIGHAADVAVLRRYRGAVDAILLDAAVSGRRGGTGTVFDWRFAVRAKRVGLPIILSGGLRPGTVARAIRQVQPAAVDVSSGVERAPGRKDPAKVTAFLQSARCAIMVAPP